MKLIATLAFAVLIATAMAAPANFTAWVGHQRRNFNPDGRRDLAGLVSPAGLASDGKLLFLAENGNSAIRNITFDGEVRTMIGGDGSGSTTGFWNESRVNQPHTLALSWDNSTLFVADSNGVIAIDLATTNTSRKLTSSLQSMAIDANGTAWFSDTTRIYAQWRVIDLGINSQNLHWMYGSSAGGFSDGVSRDMQFAGLNGLEVHYPNPSDVMTTMLVAIDNSASTLRGVHTGNQTSVTIAGVPGSSSWQDGPRGVGMFSGMNALTIPRRGLAKHAYVAGAYTIRKVDLVSGELTTILGRYGLPGLVYGLNPWQAAMGSIEGLLEHDNKLYISLHSYNTIATLELNHTQVFTVSAAMAPSTGIVAVAAALVASLLL